MSGGKLAATVAIVFELKNTNAEWSAVYLTPKSKPLDGIAIKASHAKKKRRSKQ